MFVTLLYSNGLHKSCNIIKGIVIMGQQERDLLGNSNEEMIVFFVLQVGVLVHGLLTADDPEELHCAVSPTE